MGPLWDSQKPGTVTVPHPKRGIPIGTLCEARHTRPDDLDRHLTSELFNR
jgi:hypothetical protein